jgi:hypothetical protein
VLVTTRWLELQSLNMTAMHSGGYTFSLLSLHLFINTALTLNLQLVVVLMLWRNNNASRHASLYVVHADLLYVGSSDPAAANSHCCLVSAVLY